MQKLLLLENHELIVHLITMLSNYYFLAAAASSTAGSFIHFRSLYKANTPNIVPYVATTNYNTQHSNQIQHNTIQYNNL